jgi:lysozyme family protein
MSDFDKAILILLRDERGYARDDNGRGAVNLGVTQATLDAHWRKEPDRCQALSLPKKVEDFQAGAAQRFYRAFFWDRLYLSSVNDDQVAGILFAMGVNQGPGWAVRHAKAALATIGLSAKTTREVMGALNSLTPRDAIIAIFNSALERYQSLARQNPALYADDLKGWELRLRRLCGIT